MNQDLAKLRVAAVAARARAGGATHESKCRATAFDRVANYRLGDTKAAADDAIRAARARAGAGVGAHPLIDLGKKHPGTVARSY